MKVPNKKSENYAQKKEIKKDRKKERKIKGDNSRTKEGREKKEGDILFLGGGFRKKGIRKKERKN